MRAEHRGVSIALAILVGVLAVIAYMVRPQPEPERVEARAAVVVKTMSTKPVALPTVSPVADMESTLPPPPTVAADEPDVAAPVAVPMPTTATTAAPVMAWSVHAATFEDACSAAQALVTYPLPAGWTVRCVEGHDLLGEALSLERTIILSPRPWDRPDFWAGTYAHEMGHAWSHERVTAAEYGEWGQARGFTPWACTSEGCGGNSQARIDEDFADSFACALDDRFCFRVYGGPAPTADQVALLWELIG